MDESRIKLGYLCDYPALTSRLASWFYEEWGRRQPNNSVEKIEKVLRQRMNRDELPLCLVAFLGSELVGTASLIFHEMETHPQHEHWLASVYIQETYRGRGLGSQLIKITLEEAHKLGIPDLYLYTHSHENYYARLGWIPVERPQYHGREVVIMRNRLSVEMGNEADTR
ncbi:MAG: GNAT family N-acetyltransferase [Anaerolineales bacterium]|nr:GNAT family N-acetyltransferase [Anaerolineales bacterium]